MSCPEKSRLYPEFSINLVAETKGTRVYEVIKNILYVSTFVVSCSSFKWAYLEKTIVDEDKLVELTCLIQDFVTRLEIENEKNNS
jgi:hypothetical protein